jgi:hypothetical protein
MILDCSKRGLFWNQDLLPSSQILGRSPKADTGHRTFPILPFCIETFSNCPLPVFQILDWSRPEDDDDADEQMVYKDAACSHLTLDGDEDHYTAEYQAARLDLEDYRDYDCWWKQYG